MITCRVEYYQLTWDQKAVMLSTSRVRTNKFGGLLLSGTMLRTRNQRVELIPSGPKRFEYDTEQNKWMEVSELDGVKNSNRQENDINSLLAKEMKQLYGVDMKF